MTTGSFQDRILSMVWRQWGDLGVPGPHGQPHWVIDPVALAWFTPFLVQDLDARIAGFAMGWCVQHGADLFSKSDLSAHASRVPEWVLVDFHAWCARIRHDGGGPPWPDVDVPPFPIPADARRMPRRDDAPAAVALRARRVWWPPSRADVVMAMLSTPEGTPFRAADLEPIGMTRVHLNRILNDFTAAGWLERWTEGRAHVHRLQARASLEALLEAQDKVWTSWWEVFTILAHVLQAARRSGRATFQPVAAAAGPADRQWEAFLVHDALHGCEPARHAINWHPTISHEAPIASLLDAGHALLHNVSTDGPSPRYPSSTEAP